METPVIENSEQPRTISSNATDHEQDNLVSDVSNHGGVDSKHDTTQEVRSIIEVIAATGKFWHDWNQLKSMLSFHLKQVLSEYPEAKMTSDLQNSSLGETYPELVKRLDDALHSFVEGPPFTLQRLCEILLAARSMYPNLSKLALALEKNLTVTSTLTICTDPYPAAVNQSDKGSEEPPQLESTSPVQNGTEPPMAADRDEIMAEVEEAADVNDDMTIDMETFEDIVRSSEANTVPIVSSNS